MEPINSFIIMLFQFKMSQMPETAKLKNWNVSKKKTLALGTYVQQTIACLSILAQIQTRSRTFKHGLTETMLLFESRVPTSWIAFATCLSAPTVCNDRLIFIAQFILLLPHWCRHYLKWKLLIKSLKITLIVKFCFKQRAPLFVFQIYFEKNIVS